MESLEATLATIEAEARRFDGFLERGVRRVLHPLRLIAHHRSIVSISKAERERHRDEEEHRHAVRVAVLHRAYTTADLQSELFIIAASRFRLEALVQHLERLVPGADPDALLKVHAISATRSDPGSPRPLFAGVIAAAGLLSNLVPTPVIEDFGLSQADFQRATFYTVLFALIYLGLAVGAALPALLRKRRVKRLTHDVLTYWSVRRSSVRGVP